MVHGNVPAHMNDANQEPKTAAIKTLAIVGFAAAIFVGVWLSIQVVHYIPSALSTLASLAESVYNTRAPFATESEEGEVLVTADNTTLTDTTTATTTAPLPVALPTDIKPATPPKKTPVATTTPPVVPTPIPVLVVSNPHGYTDLKVAYRGIGSYNENTKVFTPTIAIDNDTRGALRFAVENTGTKTSGLWTYIVTLPTESKSIYASPTQPPLLPGSKDTIMIAFSEIATKAGIYPITITIIDVQDSALGNNSFVWSVQVTD